MGRSLQITDGTADLVKRMGVDVYTVTENRRLQDFSQVGKIGFSSGTYRVTTSKLFDIQHFVHDVRRNRKGHRKSSFPR